MLLTFLELAGFLMVAVAASTLALLPLCLFLAGITLILGANWQASRASRAVL